MNNSTRMNDANGELEKAHAIAHDLRTQIGHAVVGQDDAVRQILTALIAAGHVLIEGVPGLGKTLMVRALARTFSGRFARIQFTPDLMPADVTGHTVYDQNSGQFTTRRGPVFTNLLLADEVNRAPAKTQAALLEVMQEGQVTIEGNSHQLEQPFMVLATQNPIEQEGTYPLPEAQLDRFMLELRVGYPTRSEEEAIVEQTTGAAREQLQQVLEADTVRAMQGLVRRIPVSKQLVRAAVTLARQTRPGEPDSPALVKEYVEWGAGPRASQYLVLGAKARAAMEGRPMADLEDVRAVAPAVLRHRVVTNFAAEAAGRTSMDLVRELVERDDWMK